MDRTQGMNQDFQDFALELNHRRREPANYTGADCIDCEKEIPEERRKALPGCRRCVKCQEQHELLAHWR